MYTQTYGTYIVLRVKLVQFVPVVFPAQLTLKGGESVNTKGFSWACVREQGTGKEILFLWCFLFYAYYPDNEVTIVVW